MSESLKPTCIKLIFAILNEDYVKMKEQRGKIEDFFDINPHTPEEDELTEILSTLDKEENIHLPIFTWRYISKGFRTHPDGNKSESELAGKYGKKLAILIWERFGIPRIS